MRFRIFQSMAVLLCGILLAVPAAAADETGKTAEEQQEAYLVRLSQLELEERYQAGKISLEEYFAEKAPLDVQAVKLGSPFAEKADPEQLSSHYQTRYNDVQYQKRVNGERLLELENTYQSHRLASPAYLTSRLRFERRAQQLQREEERILWEGAENPDGRGGDVENALWEARYRVYRCEREQALLKAVYQSEKISKQRFTERQDTLKKEAEMAAAAVKQAGREAEKSGLQRVVPEQDYNGYWDLKKRLNEIEKELEKLEEQLRAGELKSLSYQEKKGALEAERKELREQERTIYRGYEDDPRMKG
ncbi:MAG: hypothetical protein HFG27_13240 [Provencibacterium sp.]|nr:hypothetical protein [Provencibacterium sp.]